MNNSEYWSKRFKRLEDMTFEISEKYIRRLQFLFMDCDRAISTQLARFYARYAGMEGISIAEAKKTLDKGELAAFKMDIGTYIRLGKDNAEHWNPEIGRQLEMASTKYRVNRLEGLIYQMTGEIAKLMGHEHALLYTAMAEQYTDRYYHTVFEVFKGFGVGTSFDMINPKELKMILDKPWTTDGKTFSQRVWENQVKLTNTLSQVLSSACVRGESYEDTARQLSKQMDANYKNALRVVRTESAYFASRAQKNCFDDFGVEKYRFIATLDDITEEECGALDGKVFKQSEYEPGVTAPPIHPNCRCTTTPTFDDEVLPGYVEGTRTARVAQGEKTFRVSRDMTYTEFKKKYLKK